MSAPQTLSPPGFPVPRPVTGFPASVNGNPRTTTFSPNIANQSPSAADGDPPVDEQGEDGEVEDASANRRKWIIGAIVAAVLAVTVGVVIYLVLRKKDPSPGGIDIEDADNPGLKCKADCAGKTCGQSDGCGGLCSGNCPEGQVCVQQRCITCTENCVGKMCGHDGCGGSCGNCPEGQVCNGDGQCVTKCEAYNCTHEDGTPRCGDDGCGGTCWTCGTGQKCMNGRCVDESTPCQSVCLANQCGLNTCGVDCGSCPSGYQCVRGKCEQKCENPYGPAQACGVDSCGRVLGQCSPGQTCNKGQCICVPQCKGGSDGGTRQCGYNGCGGVCGECPPNFQCSGDPEYRCIIEYANVAGTWKDSEGNYYSINQAWNVAAGTINIQRWEMGPANNRDKADIPYATCDPISLMADTANGKPPYSYLREGRTIFSFGDGNDGDILTLKPTDFAPMPEIQKAPPTPEELAPGAIASTIAITLNMQHRTTLTRVNNTFIQPKRGVLLTPNTKFILGIDYTPYVAYLQGAADAPKMVAISPHSYRVGERERIYLVPKRNDSYYSITLYNRLGQRLYAYSHPDLIYNVFEYSSAILLLTWRHVVGQHSKELDIVLSTNNNTLTLLENGRPKTDAYICRNDDNTSDYFTPIRWGKSAMQWFLGTFEDDIPQ